MPKRRLNANIHNTLNKTRNNVNPFENVAGNIPTLMSAFKKFIAAQATAFPKEIRDIASQSIKPKGKFIRPLLVFSAAGDKPADKKSLVRRAAIAELIHLSTLIHDDVIDNASVRRNAETPNKKYGAHAAILIGDAIFARTMQLAFLENDNEMLGKIAECVRTICEGEIKQTLVNCNKNITRKQYFTAADGKTAVLFKLACDMGAECAQERDDEWTKVAAKAGEHLGIAYQVYDDICDWFMSEADAGKTLGTDLQSGKHTFPMIVLFEKLPKKLSEKLQKNLKLQNPETLLALMKKYSVAQDCKAEFEKRISSAEKLLAKFPNRAEALLRFCDAMKSLSFD